MANAEMSNEKCHEQAVASVYFDLFCTRRSRWFWARNFGFHSDLGLRVSSAGAGIQFAFNRKN
jgi:hypothetical protein